MYFHPIIPEYDIKTTDFDLSVAYLSQNVRSKAYHIFISV